MRRRWLMGLIGGWCAALASVAPVAAQTSDLTTLTLEDLLQTEVTSVSHKEQTLSRTAAAVYVITQEDIRRSGAQTIPDVLRLVPGFAVAAIDASSWAVSSRGFNSVFANKLLVLIDGRSMYGPITGGVFWITMNLPLDDIERIEVIRGPGGTVWGVNAINGVVNIITRTADDTLGGRVSGSLGPRQRGAEARYGSRAGARTHYRVSVKRLGDASPTVLFGLDNPDRWKANLGSGRVDWRGDSSRLVLTGLIQEGDGEHVPLLPLFATGDQGRIQQHDVFVDRNVNMAWTRSTSSRSETSVQAYYQHFRFGVSDALTGWDVADVEARQRQTLGRRHELVGGLGYRVASLMTTGSPILWFTSPEERVDLFTGFAQDEIEIVDAVHVTPGIKAEHNPFTGLELQPSLRATWVPAATHALWMAASRAVRTPVKTDRSIQVLTTTLPGAGDIPLIVKLEGAPAFRSEDVNAVELGYRWQRLSTSVDLTTFWNSYDHLKTTEAGSIRPDTFEGQPVALLPFRFVNALAATAHGIEAAATWQPYRWWKVSGSYAWLSIETRSKAAGEAGFQFPGPEPTVPNHQFQARTYLDLPHNVEASVLLFRASAIAPLQIDAYTKLDLRLAWRVARPWELSVIGQNLLHGHHREFADVYSESVPVRARVLGQIAWRF